MTVRTAMGLAAVAVAAVLSLGLGGCGGLTKHDINVTRDDSIKDMSVQVDLIGVNNPTARDKVMACDVNEYWAADGSLRNANPHHSMQFVAGGPSVRSFVRSDAIWEKWNAPSSVIVIALIPGVGGAKGMEHRRIELPMDSGYWKESPLDVRVDSKGVRVLTPSKPEK